MINLTNSVNGIDISPFLIVENENSQTFYINYNFLNEDIGKKCYLCFSISVNENFNSKNLLKAISYFNLKVTSGNANCSMTLSPYFYLCGGQIDEQAILGLFNNIEGLDNQFDSFDSYNIELNNNYSIQSFNIPGNLFTNQIENNFILLFRLICNQNMKIDRSGLNSNNIPLQQFIVLDNSGLSPFCSYDQYGFDGISLNLKRNNGELYSLIDLYKTPFNNKELSFPFMFKSELLNRYYFSDIYQMKFNFDNDGIIASTDAFDNTDLFISIENNNELYQSLCNKYSSFFIPAISNCYYSSFSNSYLVKENNDVRIYSNGNTCSRYEKVGDDYLLKTISVINSFTTYFNYNSSNKLISVSDSNNVNETTNKILISYSNNKVTSITYPNNVVASFTYNNNELSISLTKENEVIKNYKITYANLGLISQIDDLIKDESISFTYNGFKVSSISLSDGNSVLYTDSFTYLTNKTIKQTYLGKYIYYFDNYDRLIETINPDNSINVSTYNQLEINNASNIQNISQIDRLIYNPIRNSYFNKDDLSSFIITGDASYSFSNDSVTFNKSLHIINNSNSNSIIKQDITNPLVTNYKLRCIAKGNNASIVGMVYEDYFF